MSEPVMSGHSGPCALTIRHAKPGDLAALVTIERRSFAIPWSEASLAAELSGGDQSTVLVAVTPEDQVIGYIGCWFVFEEGQINNIAVDPGWRHSGVGTALISSLIALGRQQGIRQYLLEVRTSNTPARALYRKFGFVESGMRRGYYRDNDEDAIIMLKNEE